MRKAPIVILALLCALSLQFCTQPGNRQGANTSALPGNQQSTLPAPSSSKVDPEAAKFLMENNLRAGNNVHSYEAVPDVESPAPAGFKAFYVSHYGRHGSRSNWGEPLYTALVEMLTSAHDAGILTAQGDSLLEEASLVLKYHDGMDGRLTQRGVREHREIAARLYDRHPEVFKGPKKVRAIASTVQRCIISMNSFTVSLGQKNPKLSFYLDTGGKMMSYINNTGEADSITAGAGKLIADWLSDWPVDTVSLMKTIFNDQVAARTLVPSAERFQYLVLQTAQIAEDFDIPRNMYRYVPFDAIYKMWSDGNHYIYLHHGNSAEFGRERVALAQSLVQDIIDKADEAIAGGEYAADLRFGHDWPILALVSYLGIEDVSRKLSVDQVDANWYAWRNLCMASNLQMVFYRNAAGTILVKFLYNEKERHIQGLSPYQGYYYRWEDVKADPAGYLRY